MLDVLCRCSREDDDIVENPHADDVQVFMEDVVHEELEHGRGVGGPLGAHLVLEVCNEVNYVLAKNGKRDERFGKE